MQDSLKHNMDDECGNLLDLTIYRAHQAVKMNNHEEALSVYMFSTYLYLNLYNKGLRLKKCSYYLKALEESGSIYNNSGKYVEASIIYSRAIDFWMIENKIERSDTQIYNLRKNLADTFELLGLWDLSIRIREEIVRSSNKQIADKEVENIKYLRKRCYPQNYELKSSHVKFLDKLQSIVLNPDNNPVVDVVTKSHIEKKLICEEKKLLGY